MARQLILHIGTSKTGSTAIQAAFSRNRDALRAQGVVYPVSPGLTHHNLLAFAAMADHEKRDGMDSLIWNGMAPAARLAQFSAEFAAEMAAAVPGARHTVMSSEFLYMVLQTQAELHALRTMLTPWFDDISVVVYLRRQDSHFASFYTQMLRVGNTTPPDQLAMHARPRHQLDYAALVQLWESVFGTESVMARLYEAPPGDRFDVVEDFAAICGVSLPDAGVETMRGTNMSMDLAGQTLLVQLGQMLKQRDGVSDVAGPGWYALASCITAASPGRGWQPSRARAREFVAQYAAGNERLRQWKFPDRDSLFSGSFEDLPEESVTPGQDALYEAACRTILELVRRLNLHEARKSAEALKRARDTGNTRRERVAITRLLRLHPADPALRAALARLDAEAGELAGAERTQAAPGQAAMQGAVRAPEKTQAGTS